MVNYIKVIKRAILGNATSQSTSCLPTNTTDSKGAAATVLTAGDLAWNVPDVTGVNANDDFGVYMDMGDTPAGYNSGIAAILVTPVGAVAIDAEITLRAGAATGQIIATIPFTTVANGSAVTETLIPTIINLPKVPVLGPEVGIYAAVSTASTTKDVLNVKLILTHNV